MQLSLAKVGRHPLNPLQIAMVHGNLTNHPKKKRVNFLEGELQQERNKMRKLDDDEEEEEEEDEEDEEDEKDEEDED